MSDEEDLLKLKKRYEKGEIPKSRYEEERAWILGTASLLMPGGDMEDEQGGDSDGTEAGHLKKTAEISSDDVSEAPVITVDDVCRMKPAAEEKKKEAKESDLDLKYAEDEAAILGKRASCAAVSSGASSSGSFERTEPDRSFIRGTEEKNSGLSASGNDAEKNTADSAENPAGTAGILPGKNSAEKSEERDKDREPEKQKKTKRKGKAGQRVLAVLLAVFLWPAAIFYIAAKKPFPKWLNILLTVWSFAATVAAAAFLVVYFAAGWKLSSSGSGPMDTLNSTASSVTAGVSESQEADSYSVFLASLDSSLRQSYGNNYILSDNGKVLSISIWKNGLATEAEMAISNGGEELDSWSSMRSAIQTLADTIYQALGQTSDQRHVELNLLNDTNTDNVLLSFYDAECIYDAVEDASGSTPDSSDAENQATGSGSAGEAVSSSSDEKTEGAGTGVKSGAESAAGSSGSAKSSGTASTEKKEKSNEGTAENSQESASEDK
ncbi:MAG: hypothetical protein SPL54_01275 [Lachnospiraceae bacterium]|nr:hypothetical protein [Lachnospiraceae bacterium]